MDRIAVVIT